MKELGFGKAYRYAQDEPEAYAAGEDYFPEGMPEVRFYQPTPRGLEGKIGEKLAHLRELDAAAPQGRKNTHTTEDTEEHRGKPGTSG
jgi:putative ATPase